MDNYGNQTIRRLTRRQLLTTGTALGLGAASAGLLAACSTPAPTAPTSVPAAVQPTSAPAAAKPTSAPAAAPTSAPAAAPTTAPAAAPTTAPAAAGSKTLVVAVPVVAVGVDPDFHNDLAAFELYYNAYESLFQYPVKPNKDGLLEPLYAQKDIAPALAEKAEYSADGRTMTVHLRKGLMSNFGNEFTADDYMWRLQRAEALNAVGKFHLYIGTQLKKSTDAKIIDKYTVSLTTEEPSVTLYNMQAHTASCVIDSTEAKKHVTPDDPWATKWLATNIAGWGAYEIESWKAGQEIILKANPNYHGDKPKISRIIYRAVPSSANRLALIKTGSVDAAEWLEAQEWLSLKDQPGVRVDSWAANLAVYAPMLSTLEPFTDKRVRQAFSYAFPYKEVLGTVYLNTGRPMRSMVSELFPSAYDFFKFDTDLDKATALLKEAGKSSGLTTQMYVDSARPDHEQLAVLFKGNLAKIGVNLDIVKLPTGELYSRRAKQEMPLFVNLDMSGEPDNAFGLGIFLRSDAGLSNMSQYNNKEVDQLIHDGTTTLDMAKRDGIWKRVQELVMDDATWLYIVEPGYHVAVRDNVKGEAWGLLNEVSWVQADKAA